MEMRRTTHVLGTCLMTLIAISLCAANANASSLAEFDRVRVDDLSIAGFQLSTDQVVDITATTFAYRSGGTRVLLANAWILDADSREVVWELAEERSEWKSKKITTESYTAELEAGNYEVYYSTYVHKRSRKWRLDGDWYSRIFRNGMNSVYDDILDKEDLDDVDDIYRRFSVRIEGNGKALSQADVAAMHKERSAKAVVSMSRVGNHELIRKGFEVTKPMRLHVYSVGEATSGGEYDYGRIVNAETRETVWMFKESDSYHAGGAEKNRLVDAEFDVPAGKYVAIYATDDSHAWDRWNQSPPHDPLYWGLTISASNPDERAYAKAFDHEDTALKNVVVDLTKVGDSAVVKRGFSLAKPMKLRVVAMGEGDGGKMYDYGWVVNADTRKRVWEMSYRRTEEAGGASKNRRADDVIELDKGNYIAYYVSDGSHSYDAWNAAPPMDRDLWGMSLIGAEGFDARQVKEYDDERDSNFLVRITEVGDGEFLKSDFTLDKSSEVRIHAVGEGLDGRMYDYGWIEEAETGKVVWEMTYRKTEHAGGHQKNRMFNDTITLKAGKYRVYFETDGSHSFRSWNAHRPHDPEGWGISIVAVDD